MKRGADRHERQRGTDISGSLSTGRSRYRIRRLYICYRNA